MSTRPRPSRSPEKAEVRKIEAEATEIEARARERVARAKECEARASLLSTVVLAARLTLVGVVISIATSPSQLAHEAERLGHWLPPLL